MKVFLAMATLLMLKFDKAKGDLDTITFIEELMSVYPTGNRIDWPCDFEEQNYTCYGRYIPMNILPTRFQMYNDTVFILTPRYRCGVPATLSVLQLCGSKIITRIEPWPCLRANSDDDPCAILNAVDLALDDDGILWLLDIGEVNTLGPAPYCFYPPPRAPLAYKFSPASTPPRVFGINIFNGKLEYKLELDGVVCENSRLQYIQVEKTLEGDKIVYVTDAGTRSIVMFETSKGNVFKVLLPPCLEEGEKNKDILYMTLVSRVESRQANLLFLTYLTSRRMFVLSTDKLWKKKDVGEIMLVGSKPGPMVILGADCQRRIFFRMRGEGDVFMWCVDEDFITVNFELVRSSDCRRATHVSQGYLNFVWLLESNFQDFVRGTTGCLGPSAKLLPLVNRCCEGVRK